MTPPDQGPTYQLATALSCIECNETWSRADSSRWRAYLSDDEPAAVLVYCADCAEREFDF